MNKALDAFIKIKIACDTYKNVLCHGIMNPEEEKKLNDNLDIIEKTLRAFEIASYNNLDFNFIRIAENWGQYQAIFKAYNFDVPIREEDYKLIKEVLSYYEK